MKKTSRRGHHTMNELNITPLLDLVFVLLVIFIITTPQMVNSLEMALPSGKPPPPNPNQPKPKINRILVDDDGKVFLNGDFVADNALKDNLQGPEGFRPERSESGGQRLGCRGVPEHDQRAGCPAIPGHHEGRPGDAVADASGGRVARRRRERGQLVRELFPAGPRCSTSPVGPKNKTRNTPEASRPHILPIWTDAFFTQNNASGTAFPRCSGRCKSANPGCRRSRGRVGAGISADAAGLSPSNVGSFDLIRAEPSALMFRVRRSCSGAEASAWSHSARRSLNRKSA